MDEKCLVVHVMQKDKVFLQIEFKKSWLQEF